MLPKDVSGGATRWQQDLVSQESFSVWCFASLLQHRIVLLCTSRQVSSMQANTTRIKLRCAFFYRHACHGRSYMISKAYSDKPYSKFCCKHVIKAPYRKARGRTLRFMPRLASGSYRPDPCLLYTRLGFSTAAGNSITTTVQFANITHPVSTFSIFETLDIVATLARIDCNNL